MKKTDFSFNGGFPLTQDRLGYMQTSYSEMLGVLAKTGAVGTAPIKLWGMNYGAPTGGGSYIGSISDGAFFYNGEIYTFTGGNYSVLGGGWVLLVVISSATTSLYYNDGSSHPAIVDNTATLGAGPTVTNATHFPLDSMVTFGEGLWTNNTTSNFTLIPGSTISTVSSGVADGWVYYRKVPMIDALHLIFQVSALHPNTLPATSARQHVFTLPASYVPAGDRFIPVSCYHEYVGMNDSNNADLRFAQFTIDATNGYCYVDMSKHTTSGYERYMFNGYIPMVG